ncbi:MAG TPA: macro domain-containing protein [Saprospiraceae bacterium]|nr:macro domain-containing protein [Saprospiraceae bacterium]HMQ85114.1 macro domain-containing protein [Saprospiraceae bacterium]
MITYKTGNMLSAPVEALVNTVNTVGVMGKGIALQFKESFPENYKAYALAAKREEIKTGKMFVTALNRIDQLRYIINFPTKQHWKAPSQLSYISEGLVDLRHILLELNIQSVAIPPLGCGNGGLDWAVVRPMIEQALTGLEIDIQVFEPSAEVTARLEKEVADKQVNLTPARAMMLSLLYHYRHLGEYASEFAAEKLMYFLQRVGEPQLQLDFQKYFYGPYSGKVRHVLFALNGQFIHGVSLKNNRPFDPIELNIDRIGEVNRFIKEQASIEQRKRLEILIELLDGFQSPAGLELLASLDFLILENKTFDVALLGKALKKWSGRKKRLFTNHQIAAALKRLQAHKTILYPEMT